MGHLISSPAGLAMVQIQEMFHLRGLMLVSEGGYCQSQGDTLDTLLVYNTMNLTGIIQKLLLVYFP